MIRLISCVKSKANKRCEAKDMYVSPLFKYMYAYAKKRCKEVYILSAKYGLLSENTPIAPYNVTLNSMSERQKKEWAKNIMLSLSKRYDLNKETFLIMGGQNYVKYLNITNTIQPLKGLSMGNRLHWLKLHK